MNKVLAPIVMLLATACHAAEPPSRHVVVISIDGLPASYLDDPQASLPVLRGLVKSGVHSVPRRPRRLVDPRRAPPAGSRS